MLFPPSGYIPPPPCIQSPEKSLFEYDGGVVDGTIVNVIEDRILYKSETETLLGSPLLNENWNVVGIHVGSSVSSA